LKKYRIQILSIIFFLLLYFRYYLLLGYHTVYGSNTLRFQSVVVRTVGRSKAETGEPEEKAKRMSDEEFKKHITCVFVIFSFKCFQTFPQVFQLLSPQILQVELKEEKSKGKGAESDTFNQDKKYERR